MEKKVEAQMEALKDDVLKARVDLLPPAVLWSVGQVMRFGAGKYGADNWRKGMKWGRLYGAALRHLFRWWYGRTFDKESGLPHLAHAIASLMMLHACEMEEIGEDDRHKDGKL